MFGQPTNPERDPITVEDATLILTVHNSDRQLARSAPLLVVSDQSLHNLALAARNLENISRGRLLLIGMVIGALLSNDVSLDTAMMILGDDDRPHSRGTLPLDLPGIPAPGQAR